MFLINNKKNNQAKTGIHPPTSHMLSALSPILKIGALETWNDWLLHAAEDNLVFRALASPFLKTLSRNLLHV